MSVLERVTSSEGGVSALDMRNAMGRFATGVTVVTAVSSDGGLVGCTVSAFSSLSLDPPLALVCIDKGRLMSSVLSQASSFAISILSSEQAEVALCFARPRLDKFEQIAHHPASDGSPLIDGAIAHIQCDSEALLDGGDHVIVVGRVVDVRCMTGEPLLYSQGAFLNINPEVWDSAVERAPHEWLLNAPW
jgi:flavin reductase (DIM6/NTAB) family NADH-FMN oxidoreductase RutF